MPLSVPTRKLLWRAHALGVLAVVIVVGAVYAQTLGFGFVWDDETIVFGRIDKKR